MRLRDERALSRCLDGMALEMKSLTAPARVEEQLRQAFRQRRAIRVKRSEVRDRRSEIPGRWNRWLVAAAAVLLIVFGVAGLRRYVGRQSQTGVGAPDNAVAGTSPKSSPTTEVVGPTSLRAKPYQQMPEHQKNIVGSTNPQRRTRPRPSREQIARGGRPRNRDGNASQVVATGTNATTNDAESEVATQFMPLGYAGPVNLQDGGQLVRVELPRSAMLSMGLPVNMDRYSERVKADVFVGADGLARAIRFVQ